MELPLRLRDTTIVAGQGSVMITLPAKCDAEGNIYLRGGSGLGNYLATPLIKLSREGKRAAVFTLGTAPGFDDEATYEDFAVDARGKVYLLAFRRGEGKEDVKQVIVAYDSDGSYDSTIELDALFHSGHLAAFPSGGFLASGERIEEVDGVFRRTGKPFTAVLDRHGKVLKELALPGDIEREEEKEEPGPPEPADKKPVAAANAEPEPRGGATRLAAQEFDIAFNFGSAAAGEDGNVYLMRAASDPRVYVIAPDGTVVRTLTLAAPSKQSQPSPVFQAAAAKIVVGFHELESAGKARRDLFVIANAETGETLAHYVGTTELGSAVACYTPNGFTFLGAEAGRMVIRTTYPF